MHQLGFELPERTGFGGLWSAIDDAPAERTATPAAARHVVATSAGARSPAVRRAIAAFLTTTAPAEDVAA